MVDSALDTHAGDIAGGFGTIARTDTGPRRSLVSRLRTFLAILGPGLIVMVGDNDAGAFGTYTQAGQNYGTTLLWTLLLLVPVLYVNQEMVLRLGAVSGVGHARLILARFGRFWGAFSVIDLFVLNALTLVTEFVGISLALDFYGLPRPAGVVVAAALITVAATQGDFRRFERFCLILCFGSLLLIAVVVAVHAPLAATAHDLVVPALPRADLGTVMLLICGIVGTTVAPWQLFFQQSYVIDKRITPRFVDYERLDLAVGIVFVVVGAIAMMSVAAGTFAGHREFGNFVDAGAVASGIATYVGYWPGAIFAMALLDACVIGAAAVGLSTAYAIGDVLTLEHSLHRKATDAPAFYAVFAVSIALAASLVSIPGVPLGLLTNAVQVLAGVLLPSATVFLLLLSNDRSVMGPWVNTNGVNVFTGVVIAILVALSVVLTASTLFPQFGATQIAGTLAIGGLGAFGIGAYLALARPSDPPYAKPTREAKLAWRMPPLDSLPPARLSALDRIWLVVLRCYLTLAVVLVVFKVVTLATHGT